MHCWWECNMVQPRWKRDEQFLTKTKDIYHTIQQSHSLLSSQMSGNLMSTQTSTHWCLLMFIAALFLLLNLEAAKDVLLVNG